MVGDDNTPGTASGRAGSWTFFGGGHDPDMAWPRRGPDPAPPRNPPIAVYILYREIQTLWNNGTPKSLKFTPQKSAETPKIRKIGPKTPKIHPSKNLGAPSP